MTRETRIGLLVGLVFIIMFGLVLSELTRKSESDQPVLAQDPTSPPPSVVRPEPMPTPYAPTPAYVVAPQVQPAPIVVAPQPVQETGRVEMVMRRPAPVVVEPVALPEQAAPVVEPVVPVGIASGDVGPAAGVVAHVLPRQMPQEVAVVKPVEPIIERPVVKSLEPAKKTYTVQPGDNLIKIARKVYEGNEREYKRIYEANRNVLASERALVPGKVLVIPALPEKESPAIASTADSSKVPALVRERSGISEVTLEELGSRMGTTSRTPTPVPGTVKEDQPTRSSASRKLYVVKSGDSLSKIAARQMNDSSPKSIQKILKANAGRISDPNRLKVGVELEIPG